MTTREIFETLAKEFPSKFVTDTAPTGVRLGNGSHSWFSDNITQDDVDAILAALPIPMWWECRRSVHGSVRGQWKMWVMTERIIEHADVQNFECVVTLQWHESKHACALAALEAAVLWAVKETK